METNGTCPNRQDVPSTSGAAASESQRIRAAKLLAIALAALPANSAAAAQPPVWQPHTLTHDGAARTWNEIVPPACANVRARCPVLVALHGGGGSANGAQFSNRTGLAAAGAARGYAVLAPDAFDGNWNDGRPEVAAGIDDVGFIRAMIADLRGRAGVDPARIFAAGASNGGLMSYRLVCEGGGAFRAIAPVIANLGTALVERCRPGGSVSVFMIPGTADPMMPYQGGGVAGGLGNRGNRGNVVSADRTLDFWRTGMACRGAPRTERLDPVRDETAVAVTRYESCRGGAVVQRWTVEGGGHTWPGRAGARRPLRIWPVGRTATEFSATEAILDFFDAAGRAR